MTEDLDALLADAPLAPPILSTATPRKCRRHRWVPSRVGHFGEYSYFVDECAICGTPKDETRSRRGKNSRSRGNALERWACHLLGIPRVGQYGGAEDGGNSDSWITIQVKSGTYFPKMIDRWLRAVPQRAGQMRGVVLVETPGPGTKRRALLVVDLYEASAQWGPGDRNG